MLGIKDVLPLKGNLEGKVLVLDSHLLSEKFKEEKYQLWKAFGGFGCSPDCSGTAIFCVSLADGEKARWEKYDFIGIYKEKSV